MKIKIPVTVRRGISKRSHEKIGDCEQSSRDVSFVVLKWQSIYNTAVTQSYNVSIRKRSYWLSLVFICRENPRRWGLSLFADCKKVPDRLGFSRHMKTRL